MVSCKVKCKCKYFKPKRGFYVDMFLISYADVSNTIIIMIIVILIYVLFYVSPVKGDYSSLEGLGHTQTSGLQSVTRYCSI